MKNKKVVLFGLLFAVFFLGGKAIADVICLRTNETIEGIILKETEEEVELDIGAGTISLKKSEILWIDRDEGEREATLLGKEILSVKKIEELYTLSRRIKEQRHRIIQENEKRTKDYARFEKLEKKYRFFSEMQEKNELNAAEMHAVGNTKAYNVFMIEKNTCKGKKIVIEEKTEELFFESIREGKRLFGKVQELFMLQYDFNKRFLSFGEEEEMTAEGAFYFKELEKETSALVNDFTLKSVPFIREEKRIVVTAIINGEKEVRLLLDASEPVIVLSERVGAELMKFVTMPIEEVDLSREGSAAIAGEPVFLRTLRVGDVEFFSPVALSVETSFPPGVDGIIGTACFRHCVVRIDEEKNRILLYVCIAA